MPATCQELAQKRRRRHELFEVVQYEQQLPLAQPGLQHVEYPRIVRLLQRQPVRDGRAEQRGITDGAQIDENDPIRKGGRLLRRHRHGQPGLAHAAGAGERDQAHRWVP